MVTIVKDNSIYFDKDLKKVTIVSDKEVDIVFSGDIVIPIISPGDDHEIIDKEVIAYKIFSFIYNEAQQNHGIFTGKDIVYDIFPKIKKEEVVEETTTVSIDIPAKIDEYQIPDWWA